MGKEYSEKHIIPFYECDVTKRITLPSLLKLVVATSTSQSEVLGVSEKKVAEFGLGWIITHYEIDINRLPEQGETITIKTEAESYNKFFCYRNFWILDENGEELVYMQSVFALMDTQKRKITSVKKEIIAPFASEKIKTIKRPAPQAEFKESAATKNYVVRYFDLDANQHVNNAIYFIWLFDVLPIEFLRENTPKRILVNFNKEVLYGDAVVSQYSTVSSDETVITAHKVTVDEQLSCEATIYW
ncbi:acyl-[acyl-carrier-protein] thioesterase [Vagococcus sp.]|uniref:acyl-[acyl-carrier-protein] thioesterase n=1 Tax=Vagococcus sp. TaxID=1933889 RepID=UPI003F979EE6